MTPEEAQQFMAMIVVRFTTGGVIEAAFQEEGNTENVVTGPGGQVHFIDPADVIETLTVAEIAALAAGD